MSRQVMTSDVFIASGGYSLPERRLKKGMVLDLSATEIAAITAAGGTLRAVTGNDVLGEAATSNTGP